MLETTRSCLEAIGAYYAATSPYLGDSIEVESSSEPNPLESSTEPNPSISRMTLAQRGQYCKISNWVQNRTLFENQNPKKSSLNYGGDNYADALMVQSKSIFRETMNNLQKEDIYMDVAAGNGAALIQYLEMFPAGANVVGVNLTQPLEVEKIIEKDANDERFSYYLSDFKTFQKSSLVNRVSVITDIQGAFRYGCDPVQMINQMGTLLKEGGMAFIDLGYGIGIVPDGVPAEVINLDSRGKEFIGSTLLMQLWFHTIKGFDVIQEGLNVEDSIKFHDQIMEKPQEVDKYAPSRQAVYLRRNNQPVKVEPLTPTYNFDLEETKVSGAWDIIYPRYSWELSDESAALLSKVTWLIR